MSADIQEMVERMNLDGAITEMNAGQVLIPKTDADYAHNHATQRCVRILQGYIEGNGLFQLKTGR